MHSGDSSCQIPPATLSDDELDEIEDITRRLARRLGVQGVLNLQLAVKDERIWVLEANPRASRTVPFVSKAIGVSLARIATLVLTGRSLADLAAEGVLPADPHHYRHLPYTAVKAAVLPFGRFPGVDTVLGPEMKSTGEVMGIDRDPGMALAKALVSTGAGLPDERHRVRVGGQPRQAGDRLPGETAGRPRLPLGGDERHRRGPGASRHRRGAGREGVRGTPQRGGPDPRWEGGPRDQHAVRSRSAERRLLHPNGDRDGRGAVHHHPPRACSRPSAASRRSEVDRANRARSRSTTRTASGGASQSRLSFAEAAASVAGEAG